MASEESVSETVSITTEEQTEETTVVSQTFSTDETDASLDIMKEKVKDAVISGVYTQTLGGAVAVALSPVELTSTDRRKLQHKHPVQVQR